jgi:glyoxylase-like metal-dependent hydrolase (beta-lactamase superfamily II)
MRSPSVALPLLALLGACTLNLAQVEGPDANAIPTAWPYESMVFAARTADGVFVVDLGWNGADRALRRGLAQIGATPGDVTDVFMTHSHRDHIRAWPLVRHARFHINTAEVPLFTGKAVHADLPSRAARTVRGDAGPWPGEVDVRPFSGDTTFVLGTDTIRAFVVPGHTPGSTAYLYRRILFAGDAISRPYTTGYGPGMGIFSTDRARNHAELVSLFERLRPYPVEWVCTAHGKCARPDERFIRKVLR